MRFRKILATASLFFLSTLAGLPADYAPSSIVPPQPAREFRGVWVATVNNIDWPSKPGLTTAEQKRQLIAILDHAVQLRLNAVIFQVRPAGDAMYASKIEPWSEYLTGTMGKPPDPYYDPLAFAVAEAHQRGLELQAWFNPYRALHSSHSGPIAPNHVSRTHPEWVRKVGNYLWLDPGERDVQDYLLKVIMDVVKRYDVDGVQIDDYFYPDPPAGVKKWDFPDKASWRKFGAGGKLSRDDWRRQNVNTFIERLYRTIKEVKPWVKFGISPRGIWRPGYPPQIKGTDDFLQHYADSRKWLMDGWLDYFAPQLYWPIEPKAQSFPALLKWWSEQNPKGRHLWPGIAAYRAREWKPEEIPNQLRFTRRQSGATGYIVFNASSLFSNAALDAALRDQINTQPALVPASPWLGSTRPSRPVLTVGRETRGSVVTVLWRSSGEDPVRFWVLQTKSGGEWTTQILPVSKTGETFSEPAPEYISVTAVDRVGNLSLPVTVSARRPPPAREAKELKSAYKDHR